MPNLEIKLHHRYVHREKNIVYVRFGICICKVWYMYSICKVITCSFRHPLSLGLYSTQLREDYHSEVIEAYRFDS